MRERFFVQSRYRKRRNPVCISRFRYRRVGGKDPLTAADDLFRGSLKQNRQDRRARPCLFFLRTEKNVAKRKKICYTMILRRSIFRERNAGSWTLPAFWATTRSSGGFPAHLPAGGWRTAICSAALPGPGSIRSRGSCARRWNVKRTARPSPAACARAAGRRWPGSTRT